MLQKDLLSKMLDSKWKKFAGHMFFFNFLFYLLYLTTFTFIAYNKRDEKVSWLLKNCVTDLCINPKHMLSLCLLCPADATQY